MGLSRIELDYTGMYACRSADNHITKANPPIVSRHRYPAPIPTRRPKRILGKVIHI